MLEEHSDLVMHHAEILMRDNGVEAAVHRALDRLGIDREPLDESVRQMIMYYFRQAIYLHIHLRQVQEWHDTTELYPNRRKHKRKVLAFLHHILYSFAFAISRHHTYLVNMMVASDFRATYQYMEQQIPEMHYFGERLPLKPMLKAYRQTEIVQGIQAYHHNPDASGLSEMNQLRAALFIETERRLLERLQEPVFYLEAPTGSGKTNMSINLALHLLNSSLGLNKLIYVFPFNSLIEQTKQTLNRIFHKEQVNGYRMEIINSITPMVTEEELEAESSSDWKDKRAGQH